MRNVYDLLNDVETSLDDYDVKPLTDLERRKLQKAAALIAGKPKHKGRWMSAACAAALAMGFILMAPADSPVYAAKENAAYHISQFLGIEHTLDKYTDVIGTVQTDNGYVIQLNEVLLDQDTLLVSTSVYREAADGGIGEELPEAIPIGDLYVNGQNAAFSAAGGTELMEFHLVNRIDTMEELDLKLVYRNIGMRDERASGEWVFHFKADGRALVADTQIIPLNYHLALENDAEIRLADYTGNILGQRIEYSMHGLINRDIKLEGIDDKGQSIVFISSVYEGNLSGTEGHGYLHNDVSLGSVITDDTEWISLTPYLGETIRNENGQYLNQYKAAGKPFTIYLHQP